MKKKEVVKNKREFDKIIHNGFCVKNNEFVIYYLINNASINRFGISVGKKIGNAVTRNYYKRIVRNICDMNKNLYSKPKDYIIIVRKGCIEHTFKDINNSFVYLMNKIKEKEKHNEKTN